MVYNLKIFYLISPRRKFKFFFKSQNYLILNFEHSLIKFIKNMAYCWNPLNNFCKVRISTRAIVVQARNLSCNSAFRHISHSARLSQRRSMFCTRLRMPSKRALIFALFFYSFGPAYSRHPRTIRKIVQLFQLPIGLRKLCSTSFSILNNK